MTTPLSYVELSRKNMIHNLEALQKYTADGMKIAAVVKGNAYGHGLKEVVEILDGHVDYFQLDDIDELRVLRLHTQTPALVLGYIQPSDIEEALQLGCEMTLYDVARLEPLVEASKRLHIEAKIHVKIDSHLGRQGILLTDLDAFIVALKQHPSLILSGVYSHFANIEDTDDKTHAEKQIDGLRVAAESFRQAGYTSVRTHLSSTAGLLVHDKHSPEHFLVRIGIGLYGLYPSEYIRETNAALSLKPVLRWVTHIAQTKWLPPDYTVGYGLTYTTTETTNLAIVPQGYSDGYDRELSNKGTVLIHGRDCPVIGRVAMNMVAVSVSHLKNPAAGDEVVLLGTQGEHTLTTEEIAGRLGTISYEVVTRISPLLPRLIVEE